MNVDAVDAFFKATESFADAMVPTVAYVSWTRQDRQIVVKARLRLTLQGLDVAYRRFEWNGVIAETFPLAQIEKSQREFIEDILKGNLNSPNGLIEFPPQHGGRHAGQFVELHPDGLEQQSRTLVLQIRGDDQNSPLNFMPLDWDLKAADPPYDSLGELFQDFGLGLPAEPACLFEAIASDVVAMDFSCKVVGTSINLAIFAASGLVRNNISIGYRLFDKGQVVKRATVRGDQLDWSDVKGAQRGEIVLDVPPAAVLHCYACYRGVTHQHRWFNDPAVAQNPRRATYERFDPNLELLRDMCVPKDNKYARDLETAVS